MAASEDKPTMSEFVARLQHLGYKVEQYKTKVSKRTKKERLRLRYYLKSTQKPVTRISGGTRAQLLKRGVDYLPARDDSALEAAAKGIPIACAKSRLLKKKQIEKYRYQWLAAEKREKILKNERLRLKRIASSSDLPIILFTHFIL